MGAWGIHTFEDDSNLDWLDDLVFQEKPIAFFKMCLDLKGIDYLEYMACTGVLCTAVMIDALLHGPTKDLPDDARYWLESNKKLDVTKLIPAAIAGLKRFFEADAELNELWSENKALYAKWKKPIVALQARLEAALNSGATTRPAPKKKPKAPTKALAPKKVSAKKKTTPKPAAKKANQRKRAK